MEGVRKEVRYYEQGPNIGQPILEYPKVLYHDGASYVVQNEEEHQALVEKLQPKSVISVAKEEVKSRFRFRKSEEY